MNDIKNISGEHENSVGVVTPPEANQETPKDTYNTPKDSYTTPKDSCKITKAEDSVNQRHRILKLTFDSPKKLKFYLVFRLFVTLIAKLFCI